MDVTLIAQEAADYLGSCECDLFVSSSNEEKSQIEVATKDGCFACVISIPNDNQESWGIWSEKQSHLSTLQSVWDKVNMDTLNSIVPLLGALVTAVKASPQASSDDSEEEEESCSEGDYYDDDEEEPDFREVESKSFEEQKEEDSLVAKYQHSAGSGMAVKRLIKDLRALDKSKTKSGIEASPLESDLFVWRVKLTDIPVETKLGRDLQHFSQLFNVEPVISMEMRFQPDYPFSPPFIRVLTPRFQFLTGHVTIGGSICMQMLTNSGWQPSNDIESILIQVRAEILSDPDASLATRQTNTAYSLEDARIAFKRMTQKYGW